MYNFLILIYQLAVCIYSHFNPKVKKMWDGERQAIDIVRHKVDPQSEYVWFHAASLGEFEQGRPLIEELRIRQPQYKILLTFFSPSGYEVCKDYEEADIICYLPLDTRSNARRFLRAIRPVKAFFIKYEFWYNYIHILKHRNVPVYSISSIFRPDQIFFRWYGKNYAYVLRCFTHLFVQDEQSCRLLKKIGIEGNVTVSGDTRFDRVVAVKDMAKRIPLIESFCGQAEGGQASDNDQLSATSTGADQVAGVFVAGSSWPPDEEIFIRYFRQHRLLAPGKWKLIIAPHRIEEEHLWQIEHKLQGFNVARYSQCTEGDDLQKTDVLIVDTFGLLSTIYRYATITYVGGGFGDGIHNTVEAAVWSKPVIFGPNNAKFKEAQELKACGGGMEVGSYSDFADMMNRLLSDKDELQKASLSAGKYVEDNAKVTSRILQVLKL